MKLKLFSLIIALTLIFSVFGLGSSISPARATIDSVENAYVSCSEFGAAGYFSSGDGTPRKVGLTVLDGNTFQILAFTFIAQGVSGSYGGTLKFPKQPDHTVLLVDISTYPLSATGYNNWDGEPFAAGFIDCSASGFDGPAVPAGAELKTITCDVAVFDTPGGQPVGDNRIKNGQTWYVLPGATADSKGEKWVQVFVSGFGLPWIPARCVPGADTGAKPVRATGGSGTVLTTSTTKNLSPAGPKGP